VTGIETPSSVKTRVMPHLRPTRPIVISKTSHRLRLVGASKSKISITADTAFGGRCREQERGDSDPNSRNSYPEPIQPGTRIRVTVPSFLLFPDTRKGQPSLESSALCALGLTLSSGPVIQPVRRFRDLPCHPRFPGDKCLLTWSWPTPGPAKSSEPAIIRLKALNTSAFECFLRVFFLNQ